ncbi:hypothetical protein N656DRAFT_126887 [Canariomyces notabilis]|uniref:Uncharacterized protein n=1 Tax=Canariomyces notabilis TaxID=2074819 RepID=A0AAN6TCI8_9PEZI|nr:hypothetical protein N656DRAFT_126887 [Canariomyces arenarius]
MEVSEGSRCADSKPGNRMRPFASTMYACTMYPPPKPVFMGQRIWHQSLSFVLSQVHDCEERSGRKSDGCKDSLGIARLPGNRLDPPMRGDQVHVRARVIQVPLITPPFGHVGPSRPGAPQRDARASCYLQTEPRITPNSPGRRNTAISYQLIQI